MGGFGSGCWYRQRTHNTVDSLPELFAIDFKKASGTVNARPRDEYQSKAITFRYLRNGAGIFLFRTERPEQQSADTIEPILKIDATPCHFGGNRYWLRCPEPNCGRRVQSLFIDEHHTIACRKCLGLLYESQYGGGVEKRLTRLRAMHRKILRGGIKQSVLVDQTQQQFQSLIDDLRKIDRVDY